MSSASYRTLKHNSFHGLIGISQADITPPVDIYSRNWGAAKHDVASGIHQPLKLTCITFKTSATEKPLVLIGADLACINNAEDEHEFRSQLLKNFNLGVADLMFCCTHTHAGPVVSRSHSNKPGGEYIEDYLGKLQRATRDAINNSVSSAVPAVLTWHYGKCAGFKSL